MFLEFLLLFVGFLILIGGAFFLVRGATSIARRYNISGAIIGLGVVGFGTSTPELVVTIYGTMQGRDDLTFANIVGSNTFTVLFVLGIAAIIFPLIIQRNTTRFEIPLSLVAVTILYILVNDQVITGIGANTLGRLDASIMLMLFLGLLIYMYRSLQAVSDFTEPTDRAQAPQAATASILLGMGLLIGGAILVVDYAVVIAVHFGLGMRLTGITLLAVGTSLPELTTVVLAARKRHTDMAIGNVIGSNLFNVLFALPVTAIVHPIEYNTALNGDIEVLGISLIVLILFMFTISPRRLGRLEAMLLVAGYLTYVGYRLSAQLNG
ncbi:calcium/sodium antiporter [Chryseolinea sp. T2]|uniref:calcium/sodium antiporter n=1 Tax=Chryseolinea sp. T2 TaxID=3129255 RepID=UPI0030774831